jgi:hypothetical protein
MVKDRDALSSRPVPDPREEIVAYLNAHPSAADTVDGILHWWLRHQRYETAKDAIQWALDDLVKEGIINYLDIGDDKRIYFSASRPQKYQQ